MAEIATQDLITFYKDTVILYKGKPAKVKLISADKVFKILDLTTMKTVTDKEALKHIDPPIRRLGMVNFLGSVVYVERVPYRKYQIGISANNLRFQTLNVNYPEGAVHTVTQLKRMENLEIGECMFNIYPSLKECLEEIKEFGGAAAFDKQFAIDHKRQIYYKTQLVGHLPAKCSTIEKIVFNPGFEHLIILLERNYEKDPRTFPTPCSEG